MGGEGDVSGVRLKRDVSNILFFRVCFMSLINEEQRIFKAGGQS